MISAEPARFKTFGQLDVCVSYYTNVLYIFERVLCKSKVGLSTPAKFVKYLLFTPHILKSKGVMNPRNT